MQTLAIPVDMVCWFEKTGIPHPIRFKMTSNISNMIIENVFKVDKVISTEKERLAGNDMLIFKCKCVVHEIESILELKFELRTCKWLLWKM